MNASWQGFVSRMFAGGSTMAPLLKWPDVVPALSLAGSLLVAGATLAGAARLDAKSDRSLLLLFVGAILSSPLGWVYYLPLGYGPILGWMGAGSGWDGLPRLSRGAGRRARRAGPALRAPRDDGCLAAIRAREPHNRIDVLLGHAVPLDSAHDTEVAVTRQSMPGLERWGPIAAGMAIYLGLTTLLLLVGGGGRARSSTPGRSVHLTVAEPWPTMVSGDQARQFASISSSPLWTVLLATLWSSARMRSGGRCLNAVCGVAVLFLVDTIVRDSIDPARRLVLLAAVIVITPLPTLALIGMEHTLQVLLSIELAWQTALLLDDPDRAGIGTASVLAAVLTATRYEGLFLVAAAASLLAMRRRFGHAAALTAAAALPVVAFAAYSVAHGALLLPNSILMKSQPARFGTLGEGVAAVLSDWSPSSACSAGRRSWP